MRHIRQDKNKWVLTSIFYIELLSGLAMLVIGSLLVLFRWPELCQVSTGTRRSKYCRSSARPGGAGGGRAGRKVSNTGV